jgi:hypothetical protein
MQLDCSGHTEELAPEELVPFEELRLELFREEALLR